MIVKYYTTLIFTVWIYMSLQHFPEDDCYVPTEAYEVGQA